MKHIAQYITKFVVMAVLTSSTTGNCTPINRDFNLIGTQVSTKKASIAILETADGDSIPCRVGFAFGNNSTITKISQSGVVVKNMQGEMFIPIGSNLSNGGIIADMVESPHFEVIEDADSAFASMQSSAFAPLPDLSTF